MRQAQRLGVADRILFPGHIHWQDTPDYYAMCDAVAVPSVVDAHGNVDGLPNVLLEAMASGCAVVGSDVAGIPDLLDHGENGLLVPPGDATALAQALVRVLGDAPLRAQLGASARVRMQQRPWEQIAGRFEAVYAQATESTWRRHR